jgi:hypothetical protein
MPCENRKMLTNLSIFFVLLCLCLSASAKTVRMKDQSDWWSILNEKSRGPDIKPRNVDIDARTFEIAGLNLATLRSDNIIARLGRTPRISRGDASTSREQACYMSAAEDATPTYLVFEFGEDQSNFYLFADGAAWKGKNLCTRSKRVSKRLSTASGLRLGLNPEHFKAILGQADASAGDKLVYSREIKRKSSTQRFERQRKEYPEPLSDAQAHEKFDFYTLSVYIEAKFVDSKLSYLVVSKSGE